MNTDKTSSDGHSLLTVNSFPIDKSQNSQWRSGRWKVLDGRWKRIANSITVSVIVYFILVIVVNLYRQCCQPLSQSEVEKIILDSPTPAYIRSQSFTYTSGAHLAGKNQTQATYTRDLWKSYGIQTEIEEYEVLLNYPLSHRLALFNNDSLQYEAELREDVIPEDATSANPDEVPTFHGYSANGNVTGELVYANFGRIDDFRLLEKMGVNVSGKVVIMRYGTIFRGLQVKAAQGTHSKFESVLMKQNMEQLEPSYIQILMKIVISPMPPSIQMGPVDIPQLFNGGLFCSSPNCPATHQRQDSLQNQELTVPTLKNTSHPSHHFRYPLEMRCHSSRASTEVNCVAR